MTHMLSAMIASGWSWVMATGVLSVIAPELSQEFAGFPGSHPDGDERAPGMASHGRDPSIPEWGGSGPFRWVEDKVQTHLLEIP